MIMTKTHEDALYKIIGIDPGTHRLGFSLLTFNLVNYDITLLMSETIKLEKDSLYNPFIEEVHGARYARLQGLKKRLLLLLKDYQPHSVICEGSFSGKFAEAFQCGIECQLTIRETLMEYDLTLPLELVDAPTVKKTVGVNGKSHDKEDIRVAIKALSDLNNPNKVNYNLLDSHALDAIAVGYYKTQSLLTLMTQSS